MLWQLHRWHSGVGFGLHMRDRGGAVVPWWHVSGRNMAHAQSTPSVPGFCTCAWTAEWADPSCSAAADGVVRQAACLQGWAAELCSQAPTNEADLMSWLFLCISASLTWCSMLYQTQKEGYNMGPLPSFPPRQMDQTIQEDGVLDDEEETEPLFVTEHCSSLSWNVAAFLI